MFNKIAFVSLQIFYQIKKGQIKKMKTSEKLLNAVFEIWKNYNNHPFVLGIQNGNLDIEKFKYYVIQDFMYLINYTKVFAIGVAKSKSIETMQLFANYTHVLACNELNLHRKYMSELDISQERIKKIRIEIDNASYCAYMLNIAYTDEEVEILVAILSCACSYEVIAKKILANNPKAIEHKIFGSWIKTYSSDDYAAHNEKLIDAMDNLSQNYDSDRLRHLIEIFIYCSEYEMKFWDFSWQYKN